MSNFFNMDNGLFRALGKLADLMLLNILFIVCSLPIFTIGASFTAMYYVTLKLAENEEGYIARGFWKSFKQNFKQATIIWLIMLFFGIVLVLDLLILKDSTGTFVTVLRVVITATMIIYALILLYVFPILARFYNSVKDTFKNAFIMAVVNLPRTFVMLVICAASVLATFLNTYTLWYGILIWMMAGFALVAFANSFFFKKIFAKYTPADPTEEEDPDAWNLDEIEKTELDVEEVAASSEETTDASSKDETKSE
ncbi:MAG: YesL family protein [Lachnospiraceae bacterium]|nr:YesL family protein [Lachnospiraceae bacterium]